MRVPSGEHAARRASPRPRGRLRDDRGYTLVEVVIAIALMGTIVMAIMSAVQTGLRTSSDRRSAARVETAIVNAADRVNRAPTVCDYDVYVQAAVLSQGWPASAGTALEEHYVPGPTPGVPGSWQPGGCILDEPTDLLVQRVTITIQSPTGGGARTIQVVKSDV